MASPSPTISDVRPVEVALIFALAAEQGCFEDRLTGVVVTESPAGKFRTGMLDGRRVTTVVAGPGRTAAAQSCEALLLGHRPRLVISAGFCGALQPQLKRNDIVVADRFVTVAGASHAVDPATLARCSLAGAHLGPFVEVDRIVAKSSDKQRLFERTGGFVCEMESAAVAEVCAARQAAFLGIRVVSDVLGEDLPDDLGPLMEAAASPVRTLGAVVGTLWRRPSSIKDMLKLKETALLAAEALANYLASLICRLPDDRSGVENS